MKRRSAVLLAAMLALACAKDTSDDDNDDTTGEDGSDGGQSGSGTGGESGADIEDCDDLVAAFEAETASIRSCEQDEECGEVLTGTSCGCTRDWVARLDADTTRFYELIELAVEMGCELEVGSSCDCPETDGFVCDDGICNWNYK